MFVYWPPRIFGKINNRLKKRTDRSSIGKFTLGYKGIETNQYWWTLGKDIRAETNISKGFQIGINSHFAYNFINE